MEAIIFEIHSILNIASRGVVRAPLHFFDYYFSITDLYNYILKTFPRLLKNEIHMEKIVFFLLFPMRLISILYEDIILLGQEIRLP